MAEKTRERFCGYVDTFRRTAVATDSPDVREKLDELCACLEAKGCDTSIAERLLPVIDDLQILLTTCEFGAHRESACRPFFERVEEVMQSCRLA
ncbi:MAG: hypothetical protein HY900_35910 [Deltaproteobacteria bacterium]|nr:hypothetical protein [Deltaproteobacteria bacterium]